MRIACGVAIVMSALAGVALAKLPPATPEQEQAAAAKKDAEKEQLEKEKLLLEKAQDRVADYYRRTKPGASAPSPAPKVESTNMPKTTAELPRSAGPQGGRQPSAEAHSAPAK